MPAVAPEPQPARPAPVGRRSRQVAGALGIAAVVLATAAVGVWTAAPTVVAAAPRAVPAPGTTPAHGQDHDSGTRGSGGTDPGTPAAPAPSADAAPPAGTATPSNTTTPGSSAGSTTTSTTPAAPTQPEGTTPDAAPSTPAPGTTTRGILPPDNPAANIAPDPDFLTVCSGTAPDTSSACTQAALAAIDGGRAAEGLPPMVLPTDWASLTPAEQLFVATNLERTVRGLPPLSGLDPSLDQAAAAGAADGSDPAPPAGYPYEIWAANWAGALGNPLEAIDLWMYDDGPGSANVDCPSAGAAGCWGHRDNILVSLPCTSCVMGTAMDATGWEGDPAWAELLVEAQGPATTVFTWSDVTPYLPADEG